MTPPLTVATIREVEAKLSALPPVQVVLPVHQANAAKLAEWCGANKPVVPKKKRSAGISDEAFLKDLDAVTAFMKDGNWETASGRHFVALYADLHFRVYGIAPSDLGPKERAWAAKLANLLLDKEFGGARDDMANFVAWTWTREKERENWRRAQKKPGGRIDYRLQFGTRLLVDYRIDEARRKSSS